VNGPALRAMRKVLVLTYHFPPFGGAGVQRPTRMVRYLREFGYEPVVVTGPAASTGRWTPADRTLLDELPDDLAVHRVSHPEPGGSDGGDRKERWLGIRSPWSRWWIDGALETGRAAGRDVELVYAWMQPYQSAEAGALLSNALGKPWVADLGDPWALDEMIAWPTRWHARAARRKMGSVLSSARAIVMSTEEAARRVQADIRQLRAHDVLSIPNGLEPADFDVPADLRPEGTFRIVHTGYLHTNLGRQYERFALARAALGGRRRDVDVLTRSHVYLLQAVEKLRRTGVAGADTIEVHFAGVLSDADRDVLAPYDYVRTHGYLEHPQAVALMKSADLLFLPMHDLPPGSRATIVPGKTYDYLGAGRPILAAVPDGDARDLLLRAGGALVCRPRDADGMAEAIAGILDAGGSAPTPDSAVVSEFAYERLARRLADVFDRVVEERR
jgi:glycosyltransferase involved in cell wall biosynthesis